MKINACWKLVLFIALGSCKAPVYADYLDDIGFRTLATQLGASTPTGAAIRIDQVEAPTNTDPAAPLYRPDPANTAFSGVTFVAHSGTTNASFSGHATGVAISLVGNDSSTPGVAFVDNYEANNWLNQVLYSNGTGFGRPVTGTGVLANHSWVGTPNTPADSADPLTRLDWLIHRDNFVQAVGVTSATATYLSHGYNVIAVTSPNIPVSETSGAIDPFYVGGRILPHLVAPDGTVSGATPKVTSAVALLLDAVPTHTLPPDTVKALFMAGASRYPRNTGAVNLTNGYIVDTANGLDHRYGAGQVNIYNTYNLWAGGKKASVQDGGVTAATSGYDRDTAFGGAAGANNAATYPLGTLTYPGRLSVSLAWDANIVEDGRATRAFLPTAKMVYNLNLQLRDTTNNTLVASSLSAIDNTENLCVDVQKAHGYQLEVVNAQGSSFSWPYAIAWRFAVDRDGDRLTDEQETGTCPASIDAYSDDDGLADGVEDVNRNGLKDIGETDPCLIDTDGDGIQDGTELGITSPVADPDGAGPLLGTNTSLFVPDAAPSTTTSAILADTDGDGYTDGQEDLNHNGRVDPPFESNPLLASSTPANVTHAVPAFTIPGLSILGLALFAISQAMSRRLLGR